MAKEAPIVCLRADGKSALIHSLAGFLRDDIRRAAHELAHISGKNKLSRSRKVYGACPAHHAGVNAVKVQQRDFGAAKVLPQGIKENGEVGRDRDVVLEYQSILKSLREYLLVNDQVA